MVIFLSSLAWLCPEKVIFNIGPSPSSNKKKLNIKYFIKGQHRDTICQIEESPVRAFRGEKDFQLSYPGCELTLSFLSVQSLSIIHFNIEGKY